MIRLWPKKAGGYTVVEVMIVLAVSGTILASAIILFQGSQGRTDYDVAVQDVNSEITTIIKETNTAVAQFPDQYNCNTTSGQPPTITPDANPNEQGTNAGCVVLGRALRPHVGSSTLDFYTVVGCQYTNCGTSTSGNPAQLSDTNPATNAGLLKQTYSLSAATIKSSTVTPATPSASSLIGFYIDLSGSAISENATLLQINSYGAFNNDNGSNENSAVESCINNTSNSCNLISGITRWTLCLQSLYDSSRTAAIDVFSSSKGITTNVSFVGC